MKIAVSGKGGVGKTTLCAGLLLALASENKKVIGIDADPDSNLAATLEFSAPGKITPVSEMKELIEERAGEKGGFFKLNPKVDDIPDKYCVEQKGIKLLVMGSIKKAGTGCYCPENSLLKALMTHLIIGREETLIMDMEAGVEHLGRGTSGSVDALIIVVEPGLRSIETALRIKKLAGDLKIKKIFAVANKIQSSADKDSIEKNIGKIDILGFIEYNKKLVDKISNDKIGMFKTLIRNIENKI